LINFFRISLAKRVGYLRLGFSKKLHLVELFTFLEMTSPNLISILYFCRQLINVKAVKNTFLFPSFSFLILCMLVLFTTHAKAQFSQESFTEMPASLTELNDEYPNINPFYSQDGKVLWFTKADHPENIGGNGDQDIWKAVKVDGKWKTVGHNKVNINTDANELVIGTGASGLIYILRFTQGERESLTTLHAYKISGDTLVKDHFLNIPNIERYSEYFGFFVAADESYILLSMKGQFSFGKEDLYVIIRRGDGWSEPIHMGAAINSSSFEMSPFMTRDAKHLFFASGGHGSKGGPDIFVSERLDNSWRTWSKPVSLGSKINTTGFEAYFSLNEATKMASFISDKGGKVNSIYEVPYQEIDVNPLENETAHYAASGFIKLEKLPAIRIKLNLMDENNDVVQSVMTSEDGFFNIQAFLPDRNYKIAIDDSIKTDLSKADIFLTNQMGDQMVFMNEKELGMFGFKVLSGSKVEAVEEFESLASKGAIVDKSTQISGRVASFGTLNEKVQLKVLDDNNNVVETIETDEEGYFSFDTKAREKSYFLSVDADGTGLVDVYEIYLTNNSEEDDIVVTKTGQQLFGFRLLNDGRSLGMQTLPELDSEMPEVIYKSFGLKPAGFSDQLVGFLQMSKLPIIDAEIMLLDENDVVLETTKTDLEGKFAFANILENGKYSLKLAPEQQKNLDRSEIFLAKNISDVVYYLNDKNAGVFAFQKLAKPESKSISEFQSEVETGKVVSQKTSLQGKFQYAKLPKVPVKLKLMDDRENVVQVVEVDVNGEFRFENYTLNRNYFIAVEGGEGLSDIYEIYISGEHKNVLVNRTNKSVYSFKVLPSLGVMLTQSFQDDGSLEVGNKSENVIRPIEYDGLISETYLGKKQAYYEFDIEILDQTDYVSMQRIASKANSGYGVIVRFSKEAKTQGGKVELLPLDLDEANGAVKALLNFGVSESAIKVRSNGSDQLIMRVN
jgi:flagellar hook assembly protein FlgD